MTSHLARSPPFPPKLHGGVNDTWSRTITSRSGASRPRARSQLSLKLRLEVRDALSERRRGRRARAGIPRGVEIVGVVAVGREVLRRRLVRCADSPEREVLPSELADAQRLEARVVGLHPGGA